MADTRTLRLRLGAFVAVSLLLLAGLVVLFGRAPRLFSTRSDYVVTFPEAPGVGQGTPVRKSGVRIGEVAGFELDEQTGRVLVRVQVDRRYPPRTSDDVTIARGILNGDTSIDFVPHTRPGSTEPVALGERLPPGSVIEGVPPLNARTLLGQAQSVLPTAQESLSRILGTAERLQQAVPRIEAAADEIGALAKSAREFVPELRKTNAQVQTLLGVESPPPAAPRRPGHLSAQVPPPPLPDRPPVVALPQAPPGTVRAALEEITALLQSIRPAADDIRAVIRRNGPEIDRAVASIREAADRANDALNADNRKNLAATLKNLQVASDDVVRTIRLVGLLADQADKTLKEFTPRLAQIGRAADNVEKATRPFAEGSAPLVQSARELLTNLTAASEKLNQALGEVQQTLRLANRQDGTLQRVLTDPSLYANLNASAAGAAQVLARAEAIARDLQVFADKIARRPELLGVGGAVRGNTGLKESPLAPLPPSNVPQPVPSLPATPGQPPAVQPFAPVR
jgi:ABC-type transporter Mla subunit MlaD